MDEGLIGPWRSSYIQYQSQFMKLVEYVVREDTSYEYE